MAGARPMMAQMFAIIAPVFATAGIGYVWGRLGRPYDVELVTSLVFLFGAPCLVFSTLLRFDVSLAALATVALAAALALACCLATSALALRAFRLPFHSYLPAVALPNAGNMGLPICLFAFGEAGLALAIGFFAVTSVTQFTLGVRIAAGELSARRLLGTPLIYALALALAFMLSDTEPPVWIANTTRLIGGMTIPLMLITLGVSLARLEIDSFRRSLALSLLRLGMGLVVGLAIAEALALDGVLRGVVVLQSAMPVAVINYLFAQRFRREPEEVAGMVLLSTTVSFATLPLLLLLVL